MYVPTASLVHFGGAGGSRIEPYHAIIEWHRSYYTYYKKNLAGEYFFFLNWLMYFGMGAKLILSLALNFIRKEKVIGTRKP